MKRYQWIIIACLAIVTLTIVAELWMGRLPLGPDGKFGWWEESIWSSENSQRIADAYSLTHIVHGFAFYLFFWLIARKLPARYRFLLAVLLEASWEILENSPFIINRYRETTISLGYVGDSVLNSISDIFMMALGFFVAWRARVWASIVAVIAIEIALLLWVRDNLTLNIIMLIHPIETIKAWQSAGQPNIINL